MSDNIKAFLTVLGATVIGYVKEETETAFKLENALFVSVTQGPQGQPGINLAPICMFAAGDLQKGLTCDLLKDKVVFVHDVQEQLHQQYAQVVGKIAVVPAGAIDLNAVRNKR